MPCKQLSDIPTNTRKVVGGNKQRDYIRKENVSSPIVLAEAVMFTCVINALEDQDIAIVDIPNAFAQTR
jgi:hypothetical protein